MSEFDRFDVAALLGLLLIGGAVWLVAGLVGVLAYAGVVLVLIGVAAAWGKRAHQLALPPAEADTVFPGKHERGG